MDAAACKRQGFTLIELLVVITIIGILMSILIPGALGVRERGRLLECASQVSQLGKAIRSYESQHNLFPLNWGTGTTDGSASSKGHSWIALCLPQLDETVLYGLIKFGEKVDYTSKPSSTNVETVKNNKRAALSAIPLLKCPTDTGRFKDTNQKFLSGVADDTGIVGTPITNYKACLGSSWNTDPYKVIITKGRNRTDTSGKYKGDPRDYCNGAICRNYSSDGKLDTGISSAQVRDNSSQTFLVGETIVATSAFCGWYWWDGATASCGPEFNAKTYLDNTVSQAKDWTRAYSFMSRHRGGGNFCMVGGETKFISDTIDLDVYHALATVDARETIPADAF